MAQMPTSFAEINVSSVYPFPDDALVPLPAETLAQLQRQR